VSLSGRYWAFDFDHGQQPRVGVLLCNLGTPAKPTPRAVRAYLREFLADPRVVELPRFVWWPILYLFVLTFRPRRSAALYRRIWWPEGSPLLVIGQKQAAGLAQRLQQRFGERVEVVLAMRYGQPSLRQGLRQLAAAGCRRVLLFPLYPQYASATTGSTLEAAFRELARFRWVPELRSVGSYHDHPGYIAALAAAVRELWDREGPAEKLLFSFHGIPEKGFLAGDPYFCHCQKTARLVAEALDLPGERWEVAFQSKFGREPWIEPATIERVRQLGREKLPSLDVLCPGFAADCLETLEEIAITNREAFHGAGGGRFRYIPALNDRPDHLEALASIAASHMASWFAPGSLPRGEEVAARYRAFREKASYDPPWP
jgi:ferrochelatase